MPILVKEICGRILKIENNVATVTHANKFINLIKANENPFIHSLGADAFWAGVRSGQRMGGKRPSVGAIGECRGDDR
jgi:hypothetical protein